MAGKTSEINEYKRKKISIGVNKKYITTTNVQLNQYTYKPLFGNYYGLNYSGNIAGVQFSESEEKITDWFFIEGGYIQLKDEEFLRNYCNLTKSCEYYNQFLQIKKETDKYNETVDKINKKRKMWSAFFGVALIFGMLGFVWGFIEIISPLFITLDNAINLFIGGLVLFLVGMVGGLSIKTMPHKSYPDKILSIKDALKLIDEYNAALKKQLNLPENFD